MYKTENERLVYCRSLLQKTRQEVCAEWGVISVPTLVRWEHGVTTIPLKKLNSILDYFKSKGLLISAEWLQNGIGNPPINLKLHEFTEESFDDIANEIFLKINSKIKDFFLNRLSNNFCAPMLRHGDYIGGVKLKEKKNLLQLQNKFVFIFTDNDGTVGFLSEITNNQVKLKNFDNSFKSLSYQHLLHFGEVQWIARRP